MQNPSPKPHPAQPNNRRWLLGALALSLLTTSSASAQIVPVERRHRQADGRRAVRETRRYAVPSPPAHRVIERSPGVGARPRLPVANDAPSYRNGTFEQAKTKKKKFLGISRNKK